jgi:condensin complex subunit 2
VDVRALKESLWQGIRGLRAKEPAAAEQEELSFQDLIASLPPDGPAGRLADLSVHLCFICLLHLANEHGLCVKGVPQLDRLLVGDLPPLADEVLV